MTTFVPADSLHRLIKHAIDSGAAESVSDAETLFQGYRIHIEMPVEASTDPIYQASLLTAVALGRRVFLGGVTVSGKLDVRLAVPLALGFTLADAVRELGGHAAEGASDVPTVIIGGGPAARREGFCIRTVAAGWRGGILPVHAEVVPASGPAMPLAGMLCAALAINEVYLFLSRGALAAGRRTIGLSLWRPGAEADWLAPDDGEPVLTYLPSRLWLIGLGHLGQAYLWALSLLPFAKPEEVSLILQDIDLISPSTESTSILSDATLIGTKKTRAMADWAEKRGFEANIHERRFDVNFRRQPDEPAVALCGLDNAAGRRVLDQVGFDFIVEAGLGRGYRDFRTMRLHVLPGSRPAAEIWKGGTSTETVEDRPAYARLITEGTLDRCGMTLLAGKAVGAPFVGAVAATIAVSELLRLLHGGRVNRLVDIDLLSIDQRVAIPHTKDFSRLNPGFILAA